jgi:hypothetical protein
MRRMKRGAVLVALVLAFLGAPVLPRVAAQALPAPPEAAELHLSARAMQHIVARHGPDSHAPGAGKYASGTTPDMIRAMIVEAVRRGRPRPDTNGRPGTLYDYEFPSDIGTSIDGRPTRRLRVVVGPDGGVITAFPR